MTLPRVFVRRREIPFGWVGNSSYCSTFTATPAVAMLTMGNSNYVCVLFHVIQFESFASHPPLCATMSALQIWGAS